jgi:hypothetical protein
VKLYLGLAEADAGEVARMHDRAAIDAVTRVRRPDWRSGLASHALAERRVNARDARRTLTAQLEAAVAAMHAGADGRRAEVGVGAPLGEGDPPTPGHRP